MRDCEHSKLYKAKMSAIIAATQANTRVSGCSDIEPDHVAQLVDEVRIVRELELPITVRLKPVRLPDTPDRAGADAARPSHQIGGPMGGLDRRIGKRQRHHARGHLRTERRDARGPRLVVQEAVDAFLHEPFLPEILVAFQDAAEKHGVFQERILEQCLTSEVSELLVEYARLRDVTILPVPEGDYVEQGHAESIIFGSGRPTLLIPHARKRAGAFALDTVVVAWDFSRPASRAIADALPILEKTKRVCVVTVTNEKVIDAKRSGVELAKHLARHGINVALEAIDAAGRTIGDVLESYVNSHDADLLVMGAYGHSRIRDFILGGATKSMLSRPPFPIFLSH